MIRASRNRRKALKALALLALFAPGTWSARAGAAESRAPSVEEIIRRLKSPDVKADDLTENAVAVEGRRARVEASPSIDFDINFEYASAKLTPDARLILDNLGQALVDPALRDARIRIAGHTDARGSRAVNLRLSQQRARSVADYLIRYHRIEARRIMVEGLGYSQLLDPEHPESPVNRRVQVTNVGS